MTQEQTATETPQEESATDPTEVDFEAIASKYNLLQQDEEQEEAPAEEEEPQEEPAEEEETPAAEEEEPPKEEDTTPRSKALAELARREQAIMERENSIKEREQALGQIDELQKALQIDPVGTLDKLGVKDRQKLAERLYWAEIGDDAPADAREKMERESLKAKIEQLEAKLEEKQRDPEQEREQAAQQARAQQLVGEINTFAESVSPDEMPFLAKEMQDRPQEALQALYQVGDGLIQGGTWPTPKQIADELEKGIRAEVERYKPLVAGEDTASDANAKKKTSRKKRQPKTLSDADTNQRPTKKGGKDELLSTEEYIQRGISRLQKAVKTD